MPFRPGLPSYGLEQFEPRAEVELLVEFPNEADGMIGRQFLIERLGANDHLIANGRLEPPLDEQRRQRRWLRKVRSGIRRGVIICREELAQVVHPCG